MNQAGDNRPKKELLQERLNELKRRYFRAKRLSETEGKSAVVLYLSSEFEAIPIEHGNNVLIGSKLVRFDDKGNFIDFNDHGNRKPIAVWKPPANYDREVCD